MPSRVLDRLRQGKERKRGEEGGGATHKYPLTRQVLIDDHVVRFALFGGVEYPQRAYPTKQVRAKSSQQAASGAGAGERSERTGTLGLAQGKDRDVLLCKPVGHGLRDKRVGGRQFAAWVGSSVL